MLKSVNFLEISCFNHFQLYDKHLRESFRKTGPLRFGRENQFPLNFAHDICLGPKEIENGISFWKYFKINFFGRKITSASGGQIFGPTKSTK